MTEVVCDTSIVLKWFHDDGEHGVEEARALLVAHQSGRLTAWVLDLTLYELGNVLLGSFGWPASQVAAQLDDLSAICGALALSAADLRLAADIAAEHGLTFCDAAYAAAARSRGSALATADHALLGAGVGASPGTIAADLGL